MDDQFDRRELLLHLGDMLKALSCLAKTGRPDAPVTKLAKQNESLQDFEFLHALTPNMTVGAFGARVVSAFPLVAKGTARVRAQPQCVASTVQHDLFDGNPDGWKEYVVHVRKEREVVWDRASRNDTGRPSAAPEHDAAEEPTMHVQMRPLSLPKPICSMPAMTGCRLRLTFA